MSYTTDGITILETFAGGGRLLVRVANANPHTVLQCYVSGVPAAVQAAPGAVWTCELAGVADTDVVAFLAVATDRAGDDLWAAAFGSAVAAGRLRVRVPQTVAPHRPADCWRVYRGDAGDAHAGRCVHTGPIYPGGRRACGFGAHLGSGFGYDAAGAAGFGATFGAGEFGFDCEWLAWTSEPLPPGVYPVRVTVRDAAGNESDAMDTTVTLNSYARPARAPAVEHYVAATDTLTLTFTPSEDMPHG